eukprot:1044977-Prorocentrum_minimum.AAC.1
MAARYVSRSILTPSRSAASSSAATGSACPTRPSALKSAEVVPSRGEWNPRVWDMSEVYNPMHPTAASRLKFLGALKLQTI